MGAKLILFVLTLIHIVSSTEIPFFRQSGKIWKIHETALNELHKCRNRPFHAIAIVGSKKSGKSFIMSKLLEKFEESGGIRHGGNFSHGDDIVTKGINIAIVEYNRKLILLIDCEALDSLSQKKDPKLMMLLSMISQTIIYLPPRGSFLENISSMVVHCEKADLRKTEVHLNRMIALVNKSDLKGAWREDIMRTLVNDPYTLHLVRRAYPNKEVLYLAKDTDTDFIVDMNALFDNLIRKNSNFSVKGVKVCVNEYISYVQKRLVEDVNENEKNHNLIHYYARENNFNDQGFTISENEKIVSAWFGHPSDVTKRENILTPIDTDIKYFRADLTFWKITNLAPEVPKYLCISVVKKEVDLKKQVELELIKIEWIAAFTIMKGMSITEQQIETHLQTNESNTNKQLTSEYENTKTESFKWKLDTSAEASIFNVTFGVEQSMENINEHVKKTFMGKVNEHTVNKVFSRKETITFERTYNACPEGDRVIYRIQLTGKLPNGNLIQVCSGSKFQVTGYFNDINMGKPDQKKAYELLGLSELMK